MRAAPRRPAMASARMIALAPPGPRLVPHALSVTATPPCVNPRRARLGAAIDTLVVNDYGDRIDGERTASCWLNDLVVFDYTFTLKDTDDSTGVEQTRYTTRSPAR